MTVPTPDPILIIEDNNALRRAIKRILGEGYMFFEARSVAEAKRHFADVKEIKLILSDIDVIDGSTVPFHKEIKAEVERRGILRVAMTGAGSAEDRAFFLAEGITVLDKPFASADLLKIVQALVTSP